MVAGIVLLALGLKAVVVEPGEELTGYYAAALVGGPALYLVAQVAFKYRGVHILTVHRLVVAALLVGVAFLGPVDTRLGDAPDPGRGVVGRPSSSSTATTPTRVEIRSRQHEDHAVDDPEQAHQHSPAH